jgi:hypothetical protein
VASHTKRLVLILVAICIGSTEFVSAQTSSSLNPFNEIALRPSGQNVIPLYDGWFENNDGSYTLCFGYFNMNTEQAIDVPMGTGNRIEPAEFDGAQPTHFDVVPNPELTRPFRHHWCVFSVQVPADFGNGDITWTLETQGDELSVPGSLLPSYVLDEPSTTGRSTSAPFLSLNDNPPAFQGRRGLWEGPKIAKLGEPLELVARIRHPQAGTWLGWTLHQGPAAVEFSQTEIRLDAAEGMANTTVVFREAGDYVLRVQAINDTERRNEPTYGFEFYCCWTNGYVRVNVID